MNPLRPSPRLLRRIAAELVESRNPTVRAWVDAINALPRPTQSREFACTSVVATFRVGRLCGYEVWRHLDISRNDPQRRKARLWFGRRKNAGQHRALNMAKKAAAMLEAMSATELREWWSAYKGARATHKPVENLWRDESRFTDGLDYSDMRQLSHLFQRTG